LGQPLIEKRKEEKEGGFRLCENPVSQRLEEEILLKRVQKEVQKRRKTGEKRAHLSTLSKTPYKPGGICQPRDSLPLQPGNISLPLETGLKRAERS